MTVASVRLWGRAIGAVHWDAGKSVGHFEYEKAFIKSGIQVAPLVMPLSGRIYSFPNLPSESFFGLPGLLADSLPDKFGNAVINDWLVRNGRSPEQFNPVERLCYTGTRGMGALEFTPVLGPGGKRAGIVQVEALVELASEILAKRSVLSGSFSLPKRRKAFQDIIRVGTSAGGARAKAILAWNPATDEVLSGHVPAPKGFSHWLLKFDGVSGNKDREGTDPRGFGRIEYAYYKMALSAGINMAESRLLHEGGRSHFMTRRFDRDAEGKKMHMQSLAGLAHFDFNQAGIYSYEQAMVVIGELGLPMKMIEEQFRRMAFNIVARNQDDHGKNIAFLMDKRGNWSLSPAFDLNYSYNPGGVWTGSHQMTMNGKRENFSKADFEHCARNGSMKRGRGLDILKEVLDAVGRWEGFAAEAGVKEETAGRIGRMHRTGIL